MRSIIRIALKMHRRKIHSVRDEVGTGDRSPQADVRTRAREETIDVACLRYSRGFHSSLGSGDDDRSR